jgi:uncharacterized protein
MKSIPKFIPVIHVLSAKQASEETQTAMECGAGGVMLIDHSNDWKSLVTTYNQVREENPETWIGINFLDLVAANEAAAVIDMLHGPDGICRGPDALWLDNPKGLEKTRLTSGTTWAVFAGVAFKHQPQPGTGPGELENETRSIQAILQNIGLAPQNAILTTSGTATGIPAEIEKLRRLKTTLGTQPLAIASGVTPENVREHLPYVDHFLVASGIRKDFYRMNPERARELADIINNHHA